MAIGRAENGGEGAVAVAGHVELVEDEVHRDERLLVGVRHLEVLYGNLCVGTLLQTCQLDGLLGSQGGCDEQQGGYDKRLRIIHN